MARVPGFASPEVDRLLAHTWRQARRAIVLLVGGTILLLGAAMIVLPGPALLVIPLGLTVLGIEFAFARRWLSRIRAESERARRRLARH